MEIKFVNRSKEFYFLENQRNNVGFKTGVVMICGKSGVGKSELTKNFIRESDNLIPSVKVPIQQAEKNSYSPGYYLVKLARQLNEHSKKDDRLISLPAFLKKGNTSFILSKKVIQHIKDDVSELLPFSNTAKSLWDLLFSQGEFDENKFFESTHSDVLFALLEYIQFIVQKNSIIINIENIQSIDERSLELFANFIPSSNKCLYLLEYTDDDNSGFTFSELLMKIGDQTVPVYSLSVPPLNIDDVKRIIDIQPSLRWELMEKSYVKWNGNMRLLIDVLIRSKYGLPVFEENDFDLTLATKAHIEDLTLAQFFLLTVIFLHKEPVQKNLLKKLISYDVAFKYILDFDSTLDSLNRHYLIKLQEDEISLSHDSILNCIIEDNRYNLFSVIAQRFWFDTYESLLRNDDVYSSRGWLLMKVLYFASLLGLSEYIISYLKLIGEEALKSRDPLRMIKFVDDVKISLVKIGRDKYYEWIKTINYWLVEVFSKIGYSKKAMSILNEFDDSSKKYKILKAILLEQVGRHKEAIAFCNIEIQTNSKSVSYDLGLRLVRMVANFDVSNIEDAKKEFFNLYNNNNYNKCFEYGFLLRNAELFYSYSESLPFYRESIQHFLNHGAILQSAFSRITYGVHLGLTGAVEAANLQFETARLELGDVVSERHTLFNNFAVLLLFQKKPNDECEKLLRQALHTADSDFEKVAIYINLLVLMEWRDRYNEAYFIIDVINNLLVAPSFASREIIRFAYFNMYKLYEKQNLSVEAENYLQKLKALNLAETSIWRFRLHNEPILEGDEEYFLSSIDRAVSFLCNWNMEFDSSLMQYI